MFLPEGLAPAFPLAALLIRLGLLLGVNLIGLQNGLIQGLAAGLILAKLRIGVPVDDGPGPSFPSCVAMTAPDVYA